MRRTRSFLKPILRMRQLYRVSALAVFVLATTVTPVAAQSLQSVPYMVPGVSAFVFDSPSMGVRYEVSVWVPPTFKAEGGKQLPLLVVTDGNDAFNATLDAVRSLRNQGAIGDLMIASIGAPLALGEAVFTRRRVYEFSPPDWQMKDPFGEVVQQTCEKMKAAWAGPCTGGAQKFLAAINNELIAGLQTRFPVDTTQLGLVGVSAGGFFASYVIFQPGSRFTKYIISSPAMAYGDGEMDRQEARWAASHKDLKVGIYLASGSLEMSDPFLEGIGRIVSGQMRLASALTSRHYPGLRLQSDINPGLGHGDSYGTAVVRGLRFLYSVAP